jgi:acetyl esterase/lipase
MANFPEYDIEVSDVEYQNLQGKSWLARVYRPKAPGSFPGFVGMHGGAWTVGDRTNNAATDEILASRGVVVASIDFRQPPDAGYPGSIADLNLAIRWLKARGAEFGCSGVVGSFGVSSGGHQVVLNGLRPDDLRYTALPLPGHPDIDATVAFVIATWPVIDPLFRFRYAQETGRQSLIDAHLLYWGSDQAMAEGSPQTAVEEDEHIAMPPILMMLKRGDTSHPQEMQDRFIAAYRKRGGSIEVESFDDLPEHRVIPTPDNPESMRTVDVMSAFIAKHAG